MFRFNAFSNSRPSTSCYSLWFLVCTSCIRFMELCSILEPGRPARADKVAILSDAARRLNQLRVEAQKLKESNEALEGTIKSLKVRYVNFLVRLLTIK